MKLRLAFKIVANPERYSAGKVWATQGRVSRTKSIRFCAERALQCPDEPIKHHWREWQDSWRMAYELLRFADCGKKAARLLSKFADEAMRSIFASVHVPKNIFINSTS